jgi:hypothetical protein
VRIGVSSTPKFTYFKASINCYTFKVPKIKTWVEAHCKDKLVLNLFAGYISLDGCKREIRNDIDPLNSKAEYHQDALEFMVWCKDRRTKVDVIVLDPPYSYRKSMEYYNGHLNSKFKLVLDLVPDILTPNGKVITFGYHASQMGKSRGFYVHEILVIDHSGAMHSTIATVEKRIEPCPVNSKVGQHECLECRNR